MVRADKILPDDVTTGKIVPSRKESFSDPSTSPEEFAAPAVRITSFSTVVDSSAFAFVRGYGKAVISMVDLATDIMMVSKFYLQGRTNFARATASCIVVNLGMQSLITLMNNAKFRWPRQLREQLIVFTLIKPGVDAYRYRKAVKNRSELGVMDIQVEMTMTRVLEMVTEAVPGTVIQLAAVISSVSDPAANLALLSSITTAAFMSAMISYDWDTGKQERYNNPLFYGYVGDSLRAKLMVTLLLFFFAFSNLAVRALSLVLLSLHGPSTVAAVFVSEMSFYFVFKAIRGDLQYWIPAFGISNILCTFFGRFLAKVSTDWTAVVQFRHPNEVGGTYFLFNVFVTILIGLATAFQYDSSDAPGHSWKEPKIIRSMTLGCVGVALSLALLLLSVKREYLHTFTNAQTGSSYCQSSFRTAFDDRKRIMIFLNHETKWRYDIGDEVREWLNSRLEGWIEREEEWFDAYVKSTVPDWIVDNGRLLRKIRGADVKAIIDKKRRGSSIKLISKVTVEKKKSGGENKEIVEVV